MIFRRIPSMPTFGLRSPWNELERMQREMDSLFGRVGDSYPRVSAGVFPAINLSEDSENYYVRAELPGVKAGDLDIQATGNSLSIAGERKIQAESDGGRYHRRERDAGQFSRMVGLPGDIDTQKVDAKLDCGILTVTVPKAEAAKPRQISVS